MSEAGSIHSLNESANGETYVWLIFTKKGSWQNISIITPKLLIVENLKIIFWLETN